MIINVFVLHLPGFALPIGRCCEHSPEGYAPNTSLLSLDDVSKHLRKRTLDCYVDHNDSILSQLHTYIEIENPLDKLQCLW
jgi:hypothetical protein